MPSILCAPSTSSSGSRSPKTSARTCRHCSRLAHYPYFLVLELYQSKSAERTHSRFSVAYELTSCVAIEQCDRTAI